MDSQTQNQLFDRILRTVSENPNIGYVELQELVGESSINDSIYKLVYLRLLISSRKSISTDTFYLPGEVDDLVKKGKEYEAIVEIVKKKKVFSWRAFFMSFGISFGPIASYSIFFGINVSTMVAGAITSLALIIFIFSILSKYKLSLQSLSLLIFFHLVVFPAIYAGLLRSNPFSFSVDGEVKSIASISARKSALEKYDFKNASAAIKAIELMLKNNSKELYSNTKKLESFGIIKIDTFLLHKTFNLPLPESFDDSSGAFLHIFNSKGDLISKTHGLGGPRNDLDKSSDSLKELLKKQSARLNIEVKNYMLNDKAITENRFWTYLDVLPHAINIFSLSNIVPKTSLANLIFTCHQWIFYILFGFTALTDISKEILNKFLNRDQEN
ncbi:hypothetical protein [Pedobacter sp. P26]|uniref:hypothetical protein n=1 Tax=Pedobacter sp. P26 TaxID=3423956 RepID=UPI003D67670E